jgi:hypothetical protein
MYCTFRDALLRKRLACVVESWRCRAVDLSIGNIAIVVAVNAAARTPSRQVNSVCAAWTLSPFIGVWLVSRSGMLVSPATSANTSTMTRGPVFAAVFRESS